MFDIKVDKNIHINTIMFLCLVDVIGVSVVEIKRD
jgi:hypothetical protein